LESNNSSVNGPAAGYANYRYQQFGGFVSQYGSGEAGVTNYATQVYQANPNATFGDMYGGYVTGTGNPANASINSLLTTTQPGAQGAYSNLMNNSPIPANTPLGSLLGDQTYASGATGAATNPNSVFDTGASPYSNPSVGGFDTNNPTAYNFGDTGYGGTGYSATTGDTSSMWGGNLTFGQSQGFGGTGVSDVAGTNTATPSGDFSGAGSSVGDAASNPMGDISGANANTATDLAGGTNPLGVDTATGLMGSVINGLASTSSSGGGSFFAWLGDWAIRGTVIFLGFIFIAAGLFLLKGNSILIPELGVAKAAAKAIK
jgi:hypothetical protein